MNLCVFYFFYNRYFTLCTSKNTKLRAKVMLIINRYDSSMFLSIKTFKTHIQIVIQKHE